jgi:hypothetical protein
MDISSPGQLLAQVADDIAIRNEQLIALQIQFLAYYRRQAVLAKDDSESYQDFELRAAMLRVAAGYERTATATEKWLDAMEGVKFRFADAIGGTTSSRNRV